MLAMRPKQLRPSHLYAGCQAPGRKRHERGALCPHPTTFLSIPLLPIPVSVVVGFPSLLGQAHGNTVCLNVTKVLLFHWVMHCVWMSSPVLCQSLVLHMAYILISVENTRCC